MLALSALNRASFESLRSCGRTITSDTKQSSRHRTEKFDTRRQRGHALATSAFGQERSFKTGSESERHGKNPAAGCGRLLHRRIFSILGMCGRSDCQIRFRYRSWHCLGGSRVANRTSIFGVRLPKNWQTCRDAVDDCTYRAMHASSRFRSVASIAEFSTW